MRLVDAGSASVPPRLHPLRLLVAGNDQLFQTGLLVALGDRYRVVTAGPLRPPKELVEAIAHDRIDVALLEVGDDLVTAVRATATLFGLAPRVGVVVLVEDVEGVPTNLRVISKAVDGSEILDAIERAYRDGNPLWEEWRRSRRFA